MIDITEKERDIVSQILNRIVPEYPVWVFGSRVKGTSKPFSDLDLAVITDKPLSLQKHAELVEAFSESDLPWKVDIVDWAVTSEQFKAIIQNQYEIWTGQAV